jgi:FkbM family methyltransferase
MTVQWDRPSERALSYFYHNTLRYYVRSELGAYIARIARRGDTFVDIGANLGFYSLIARLNDMRAIAVEPEPAHADFLKRNEQIFGRVLEVALSDQPGALPLYYDARHPGATSLVAAEGFVRGDKSVAVQTFSDVAARGEFGPSNRIRLIKVDVEGHEAATVRGLEAFLQVGHRPDIWCEVRGGASKRAPNTYVEVCQLLAKYGYDAATDDGTPLPAAPHSMVANKHIFDLLFTSREGGGPEQGGGR